MKNSNKKPIVTVDVAYLSIKDGDLEILLVTRSQDPFAGMSALPGGYVHCDEDLNLEDTANRVIATKTNLIPDYIEQIETIATKDRDPRGWTATVLYMALVSAEKRDDIENLSTDCKWVTLKSVHKIPMAFDHHILISKVEERLVAKSRYTSIPLYFLPRRFSLSEAQLIFEASTRSRLEKKAFRRRLLDADIIEETGELSETGKRKAALYRIRENSRVHFFPRMVGY